MVKTAESGNSRAQAFCPECGSPLYGAAPVADPPSFLLRVGAIRRATPAESAGVVPLGA